MWDGAIPPLPRPGGMDSRRRGNDGGVRGRRGPPRYAGWTGCVGRGDSPLATPRRDGFHAVAGMTEGGEGARALDTRGKRVVWDGVIPPATPRRDGSPAVAGMTVVQRSPFAGMTDWGADDAVAGMTEEGNMANAYVSLDVFKGSGVLNIVGS